MKNMRNIELHMLTKMQTSISFPCRVKYVFRHLTFNENSNQSLFKTLDQFSLSSLEMRVIINNNKKIIYVHTQNKTGLSNIYMNHIKND